MPIDIPNMFFYGFFSSLNLRIIGNSIYTCQLVKPVPETAQRIEASTASIALLRRRRETFLSLTTAR